MSNYNAKQPRPARRRSARPGHMMMALEPRIMFDAAAVASAASAFDDGSDHAPLPVARAASHRTPVQDSDAAARVADMAAAPAASQAPAGLFNLVGAVPAAALAGARADATRAIDAFLASPLARQQLADLFNGGDSTASPDLLRSAQAVLDAYRAGTLSLDVQLRSNLDMHGAMGAFAAAGADGKPVIYLNADWVANGAARSDITRVLVEEFGHGLDTAINGRADTAGDEGDAFATALLGRTASDDYRLGLDDRSSIDIDGAAVAIEQASASFKALFAGTPSAWRLEASSITLTSQVDAVGSSIQFISADPSAAYFSGNNVAGNLVYTDSAGAVHTIGGVISRQFKTGGTTNAFYFYSTGANGLVDGTDDTAYLLQVSTDSTSFVFNGTDSAKYGTSSDPVSTSLNTIINAGVPVLTAATSSASGAQVAIEAGGASNATAGQNGTGNVLDASLATGTGLTVKSVGAASATQSAITASTTSANGTAITGAYGTLTMGADGTYSYVVNNSNTTVQALRQATDTLTESFYYTVTDSSGKLAATTLTVTINGKNDTPAGVDDYGSAKATLSSVSTGNQYTSSDSFGSKGTGNVLTNDTDVDGYSETRSIAGVTASGTYSSYTAGGASTSLSFLSTQGGSLNAVSVGDYAYTPQIGGRYYVLKSSSGANITVTSKAQNSDGSYSLGLSATPTKYNTGSADVAYSLVSGAHVDFAATLSNNDNSIGGIKDATISASTSVSTSTLTLAVTDGFVVVGMAVTGTNIPASTTVTAVTGNTGTITVTLDQALPSAPSGTISFLGAGGTTLNGNYGALVLAADGSYTYTPTADTAGGTEHFKYSMTDAGGLTSTATLHITVLASAASDPNAIADAVTGAETAASAGTDPAGNVISGTISTGSGSASTADGAGSGATLSANPVTAGRTASASSSTSITSGSFQDFGGQYGTLRLYSTGAYTYTINNSLAAVDGLNSGGTLSEVFYYTVTNSASLTDTAALTITINGANDAPTLDLSPANSGSLNTASTFSQADGVAVPLATLTGSHLADVDNTTYSKLTLAYTMANFSDGASEQLLINGATGANTSIASLGALSNGASGSFTLSGVNYTYAVAVASGTATITFTPGSAVSLANAEALLVALRYKDSAATPTANSNRVVSVTLFDAGTQASNTATSTLTVYGTSTVPAALADTASATEAGGTSNGTAGIDPTGNVISGTDIGDTGTSITVTLAKAGSTVTGGSSVAASSTSASNGTSITGSYGTLVIGADGSYAYTVDNSNSTVAALQVGSSVTDTFSYQITDNASQSASATLTVTVNGANDAPTVGTAPTNQSATVNSAFSYTIPAFSDVDAADTITYSSSGTLPTGVTFNAGTRTYSGTPTASQSAQTITVTGTDSRGATVTTTFTLAAVAVVSDTTAPSAPTLDLMAASDSGTSSTDDKTSVTTPVIRVSFTGSGATAPVSGDVVKLYEGSTQVGTATLAGADISAGYVDISSSTLAAGSKSFTATITDAATNVSSASTALPVTIDTTAPLISTASVNGTTLTLTYTEAGVGMAGTTPAAGDFSLTKGTGNTAVAINSVSVDSSAKTVTLTLASAIDSSDTNVLLNYTAGTNKTQDIAGNVAANLASQAVTVATPDTTAPGTPTLDLLAASDSGTSSTDDKTSVTAPVIRVSFTGSGATAVVAGDVVKLYEGSTQVGTATLAGADITAGYVDITSSTLAAGSKSFTATITDAATNVSSASTALPVTIDTTAPVLASATVFNTALTLTYTEAGAGVAGTTPSASDFTLTKGVGNTAVVVNSVSVDTSAKTVTLTLASAIDSSDTNVLVTYVAGTNKTQDVAGNVAANFSSQAVTVTSTDITAPGAPTLDLLAASDSGTSSTDDKTSVTTPVIRVSFTGSGATAVVAGDVVKLYEGSTQVGTATLAGADITAGYVDITSSTLAAGSKSFTATITDAATNVSSASTALPVTIDTTAPLISAASANGTTLTLTYTEAGSGMAGTTPAAGDFSLTKGVGNTAVAINSVSVDTSAKTVTLTLASAIDSSDTNVLLNYTAGTNKTQDIAGNVAANLSSQAVTVATLDTTAPGTPTLDLLAASDSGTSSTDDKTSVTTPVIRVSFTGSGATAPVSGDVVKLYEGSPQVGTATLAGADITAGYVDITSSTLAAGSKSFTATITDAATNVSSASTALPVTIDTTAPLISTASVNGTTLTLTYTEAGVGMAGTTPAAGDFSLTKGVGNAAVAINGVSVDTSAKTVTLTLASAIDSSDTNVLLNYTAGTNKTQDIAGNVAANLSSRAVTVSTPDTTAPAAPTLDLLAASDSGTSSSDDKTNVTTPVMRVTFNGSGATAPVAGDVVKLYEGATQVGSATLASGNISAGYVDIASSALAAGSKSFTATITDAATNVSSASTALPVSIDTTAPLFSSASVNGSTLTLNYAEGGVGMAGTTPAAGDFSLTKGAGNAAVAINSVSVDANARTVTLTLASAIDSADTNVRLNYTSGSSKIEDIAANAAGNLNGQAVTVLTPDTTAPAAPTLDLLASSDSGTSSTDDKTGVTAPVIRVSFSGSGATAPVAGDVVKLFEGASQVGSATLAGANISAGYVDIASATLAAGGKRFSATITDAAANVSPASTALPVTIDTTAPLVTSASVNGSTLTLGYAEAGVGMAGTTPAAGDFSLTKGVGNAAVAINGVSVDTSAKTVTLTLASAIDSSDTNVLLNYTAGTNKTQDIAGNVAANLSSRAVTVSTPDTTAPAAPTLDLLAASDSGTSSSDDKTNVTTPVMRVTFNGSGAAAPVAGDVVKLYEGATQVGSATLAAANIAAGYVDIASSALAAGSKSFTATITDVTNHASAASAVLPVTIDTTAPLFSSASVNGTTLTLTYAEAGVGMAASAPSASSFSLTKGAGNTPVAVNSASVDPAARTVTLRLASAIESHDTNVLLNYVAGAGKTADIAGNAAANLAASPVTVLTPDVTAPAAPTLDLVAASDSGTSSSDDKTKVTAPVIRVALNGSGATAPVAGDVVKLIDGASQVGSATLAAANIAAGFVDVTSATLAAGSKSFSATITDVANHVSGASAPLAVVIDTTAPLFAAASVNGSVLTLSYTEAGVGMAGTTPAAGDFTLTEGAGNTPVAVTGVSVDASANTVTLNLASIIDSTATNVLLNYVAGASKTGDIAGNGAANLASRPVAVLTPDTTAPVVVAGQSFNYAENQGAGAVLGTVAATDRAGVTGFRFSATSGSASADGYFTIAANGQVSITASGVAAGVAQNDFETAPNSFSYAVQACDAAGNWSAPGAIALNVTDVFEDITPPSIVVAAPQTTLQPGQSVTLTFTLSELPGSNGFGTGDIAVAGGTLSDFSGSGLLYTALFTPTPHQGGTGIIAVAASQFNDAAGNLNLPSNSLQLTVLPPTLPAPTIALTSDTGVSSSDAITRLGGVTVGGIVDGATASYSTDNGATWSGTFNAREGSNSVLVRQSDEWGTVSPAAALQFVLDTVIATPSIALVNDTGSSNSDRLTADAALAISGAAADVTRSVATDGSAGAGSYTAPSAAGSHSVQVSDADLAGNTASASITFTLGAVPTAPTVALVTDSGSNGADRLTNAPALTFSAVPPGATRSIVLDGVAQGGNYVAPGTDGLHTVVVTDTNVFGASASTSYSFTLDRTIATPSIALVEDSGDSATDRMTNNPALAIGAAAGDVTRTVSVDGGPATAAYVAPTVPGAHSVSVVDVDRAGNSTSASFDFTLGGPLATPTIALVQDSGSSSADRITNNPALAFSAQADGVRRVFSVNGAAPVASYQAPATDGSYTVSVTDTNLFGASASTSFTFVYDKTIATPVVTLVADTGASATDRLTSNGAVSVTAPAADVARSVVASGAVGDGVRTTTVTDVDVAGNSATGSLTYTVDTAGPQLAVTGGTGASAGNTTLTGSAADLSGADSVTVVLTNGSASRTLTAQIVNGQWTVSADSLGEGDWTITLSSVDRLGNATTVNGGTISVTIPRPVEAPAVTPPAASPAPLPVTVAAPLPAAEPAPASQPAAPQVPNLPAQVPTLAAVAVPDLSAALPVADSGSSSLVSASPATDFAGTQSRLMVANTPPTMQAELGKQSEVQLPAGIFRTTDSTARVNVEATLSDGKPLPSWLTFDPSTGKFSGTAPVGSQGQIDIKLKATDDAGNAANVTFTLVVADSPSAKVAGTSPAAAPQPAPAQGAAPLPDAVQAQGAAGSSSAEAGLAPAGGVVALAPRDAAQGNVALFVADQPPPSETRTGTALNYQLPSGLFRHTDPAATTTTQAIQADGKPLPAWLKYDAATGKFTGVAPKSAVGILEIKVIARDDQGREANVKFKIQIGEQDDQQGKDQAQQPKEGDKDGGTDAGKADGKAGAPVPVKSAQLPGKASLSTQLARFGQAGSQRERAQLLRHVVQAAERAKNAA